MTTLNARAVKAWREADAAANWNIDRDDFIEGWETGHKAAAGDLAEIQAQALEDAAEEIVIPGASSLAAAWLQGRATRLRNGSE